MELESRPISSKKLGHGLQRPTGSPAPPVSPVSSRDTLSDTPNTTFDDIVGFH